METNNNTNHHETIWDLLPWFVNNSLADDEHKQVTEHLLQCKLCSTELQSQRRIQKNLIANKTDSSQEDFAFKNIMLRINANSKESSQIETQSNNVFPIKRLIQYTKKHHFSALPTAVAASVLIALAVGLFLNNPANEQHFTTLFDADQANTPDTTNNKQYLTRLIFDENTSRATIQSILDKFRAVISDGPDQRGIYTIDFSKAVSSVTHYQQLITKLKQQPEVLLVSTINK